MNHDEAMAYLGANHRGVLATIRRDGMPQLSHVSYALLDGRVAISVTQDRAKTRNARRDPRVVLSVVGDDWYRYVVAEGTAEIVEGEGVLAELRRVYEAVTGAPHPDWDDFDAAMIRDRRCVLRFPVERLYPLT
ncbi:MAG: Pyridoxine 5'-phosphate oxidase, Rv1155 [uncultured Thermomicrobiales bacterium]|uniref:Pyridoxine 5'-phosphate oxidase, Rv1155 n=1 Tax=uncultured Thermomicrobiales bacterium TaxID=1645740 RepID=A0A6J4VIB2_9BACT|nr:MAG: Pyridoxine 5'-phosphate oxidase, Rv1155 [uncultured Thermomicrobiales bacterium]